MNSMEKKLALRQKALDEDKTVVAMMKNWRVLFDSLSANRGMSVMAFADKHGFSDSLLSHQMAGRKGGSMQYVKNVNKALRHELGTKLWKSCAQ